MSLTINSIFNKICNTYKDIDILYKTIDTGINGNSIGVVVSKQYKTYYGTLLYIKNNEPYFITVTSTDTLEECISHTEKWYEDVLHKLLMFGVFDITDVYELPEHTLNSFDIKHVDKHIIEALMLSQGVLTEDIISLSTQQLFNDMHK